MIYLMMLLIWLKVQVDELLCRYVVIVSFEKWQWSRIHQQAGAESLVSAYVFSVLLFSRFFFYDTQTGVDVSK